MKRALLHILSVSLFCSAVACEEKLDSSEPTAAVDAERPMAISNIACAGFENCYDGDDWDCRASASEGELDLIDVAGSCCALANYDFCYDYGAFNCDLEDDEFSACLDSATSSEEDAVCIGRAEDPFAAQGMIDCCASADYAFCEYVTDPEQEELCQAGQEQGDECEPVRGYPDTCDRDDADIEYAADDAEACAGISIHCLPDWQYFETECGCGCEFIG